MHPSWPQAFCDVFPCEPGRLRRYPVRFDKKDSTTREPRTHIAGAPHEHGMFRGDWLLYGRVRDAKLEFEGLFEA
jgi:hypothetical protein